VITAVPGVRVGHWTEPVAATGCTVVLLPHGTVGSCEVRGGAPATRELAVLDPQRTVQRLDAVALCGGSAFGLAAADGVMRWLEERGIGVPTLGGPVPIVAAMSVYDLASGDPRVRPGAREGYAACVAATSGEVALGAAGAGTGCTIAKWRGREHARPGGLGTGVVTDGDLVVAALLAVNAFGDVRTDGALRVPVEPQLAFTDTENTTAGVVATNARLTKMECLLVAQSAHDGLATALDPVHTAGDGDAVVTAATGAVAASTWAVRSLAAHVVDLAVRDAVARTAAGAVDHGHGTGRERASGS
jgi:L-aminopeptidase/D-esterase-like protein